VAEDYRRLAQLVLQDGAADRDRTKPELEMAHAAGDGQTS